MSKTQKNKATAYHLGLLKAKLAKLRRELLTPTSGGGGAGEGYYLLFIFFSTSYFISLWISWIRLCYNNCFGLP